MSNFDLKLIPKAKEEITKYVNFMPAESLRLKDFSGKIIYINTGHPGKHIYSPYYVYGDTATLLSFEHKDKKQAPAFTIDELKFEDVIGFYTIEEWDKYCEERKKQNKKS